jgi:carboxymethylenebutenolidase
VTFKTQVASEVKTTKEGFPVNIWTLVLGAVVVVVVGGMVWLNQSTSNASLQAVQQIELSLADGSTFDAYVGGPENANRAVMIVHDWFGISEMSKQTVERLGSMGYRTLAVDLYKGESATTHGEAGALMGSLVGAEVFEKLQIALDSLKAPGRVIASMGFSMGAPLALRATLNDPSSVAATVLFYGNAVTDPEALSVLESPVLFMTGSKDNPQVGFTFSNAMDEAGKMAELYIYPGARHAYAQPLFNGGQNFDETATRVSWVLADDFLIRHLSE